jgi:hypothetical protein
MSQSMQFTKTQYGPESSTYGTEAAAYNELARVQSISIEPTNNIIYDRGLGEGLNATNAYYGNFDASGNVTFDVVDFDFLKHFVGPKTGAGSAGDKYTLTEASLTAVSGSTALVPFSIEYLNDDTTNQATVGLGCMGSSFTLSGKIQSKLSCQANFVCQKTLERESGQTYVAVTAPAFVMLNGTWKFNTTPSTLSGVREFSISMDNGLVTDTFSIESRFRNIPKLGTRVYRWTLSVIMAQALGDQVVEYFYGKESPTNTYTPEDGSTSVSPLPDVEFSIDLVNGSKYATIHLDQCIIETYSKPVSIGGGLVVINFEGTALYGKSNAPIKWWSV